MTDSLNQHESDIRGIVEKCKRNSGVSTEPFYEEITVMKTEIKEESYDCEMSEDNIEFVNVKEEYISSPEHNYKEENLHLINITEQSSNENFDVENSNKNDTIYNCQYCIYSTCHKAYLTRHIRTHSNEKLFKCTYKNCKCPSGQERPCECNICEYVAKRSYDLNRHILLKHSGKLGEYKCESCEYVTHMRQALLRHSRIHTNEKPFKCTYKNCKCTPGEEESCKCNMCEYTAKDESNLKAHILAKHSGMIKKYKCKDCTFVTHAKQYLAKHERLHIDENMFKCNMCEYAGKRKYQLKQHVLAMHGQEPKRYQCKDCKFATHYKRHLTWHMYTHTNSKPFKCSYKNSNCTHREEESCECGPCGYATRKPYTLKTHALAKHAGKAETFRKGDIITELHN